MITKVVLGWHSKKSTKDLFFGTLLENVIDKTGKAIFVTHITSPLHLIEKIHVLIPPAAELELGFTEWIDTVLNISSQSSSKIYFWGYEHSHEKIKQYIKTKKASPDIDYRKAKCLTMLKVVSRKLSEEDLLIIIGARRNTLSYNRHIKQIPYQIDVHEKNINTVLIYPEQEIMYKESIELQV